MKRINGWPYAAVRLIVLFDDNGISIDGRTDLTVSDNITGRFESYGWQVSACDGHDQDAVSAAITAAKADNRPSLIRCKTVIGFGSPAKQGTSGVHGAPLGDTEIEAARAALDWPHSAFEIPADILAQWRAVGAQGDSTRAVWQKKHDSHPKAALFDAAMRGDVPDEFAQPSLIGKPHWRLTRKSSPPALPAKKHLKRFYRPARLCLVVRLT